MCRRWRFTDEVRHLLLVGRDYSAHRQDMVFAQGLARMDAIPRLQGVSVEER
jgi:hypothetical protein